MKKAVLYARVSSKEQEREGFSIPAQRKLLQAYALEHGLDVVAEFREAETAKKAGRTEFQKMIAYLDAHSDVRDVLVEKTDRLYRNLRITRGLTLNNAICESISSKRARSYRKTPNPTRSSSTASRC